MEGRVGTRSCYAIVYFTWKTIVWSATGGGGDRREGSYQGLLLYCLIHMESYIMEHYERGREGGKRKGTRSFCAIA